MSDAFIQKLEDNEISIQIEYEDKPIFIENLINAIRYQQGVEEEDVAPFLSNVEDANIFTECFNILSKVYTKQILKVFRCNIADGVISCEKDWETKSKEYELKNKYYDDEPFFIQFMHKDVAYKVCKVNFDTITFDSWRVQCCMRF